MTDTPTDQRTCPVCGEEVRMAWMSGDPPEPYGEVCGCDAEDYREACVEKRAMDRDTLRPWRDL